MLLGKFFKSCFCSISRRSFLFATTNAIYFGCIFAAAVLGQFLYEQLPYLGELGGVDEFFFGFDWPLIILSIFLFNLVLSSFVFVTLPGLVFFPLSVVALVVRAVFWGIMLNQLPTPLFLAVFPTLILEGEAYVFAGVAGVDLGLSWLKPILAYKDENLSRSDAFKKALKECLRVYVLVAMFLLVAAIVETYSIAYFESGSYFANARAWDVSLCN
jgi:hypothetical protein